ncbi:hypothetical protein HON52_03005 [Candidatus Uhrbacteria bacterium]|jgi:hypothetical protein|nr:hypothetical protein [Candidatus Uhrbacteria bacterium]
MAKLISIGQIIDRTWEIYSTNFKSLMKISMWAFLVGIFVIIRLLLLPSGETAAIQEIMGTNPEQTLIIGFAIAVAISIFAIPITSIWVYMNLVRGVDNSIAKKKYSTKELGRQSWRDFLPYLWVMILKNIANVLPILLIVPGAILLILSLMYNGVAINSIGLLLTFLGTVAALVMVIWLGVRLTFAGYAMLLDGKGGLTSLKESFRVTEGRFWASLWRIIIPKLVFGSGVLVAEILLGLILPLLVGSLYNLGPTFGLYAGLTITVALTTGLRVLYPPLFIIADELLYGSLKQTR